MYLAVKQETVKKNQPCEIVRESYLKTIKIDDGLEGSFFLMSGVFKDTVVYNYYEIMEDGSYHLERAPAQASVIYEDIAEGERPYVIIMSGYPCKIPAGIAKLELGWYIFHIPEGSIKETMDISLP